MLAVRTLTQFAFRALVPVVVLELSLAPFWLARTYADHPWLPAVQLLLTGLLLPVYLAVIGIGFVGRNSFSPAFRALGISLGAVVLSIVLHYAVWGVSTGQFGTPDWETVVYLSTVGEVALGIALLPPFLAMLWRGVERASRRRLADGNRTEGRQTKG